MNISLKAAEVMLGSAKEWTDYLISEDSRFGFFPKHDWLNVDRIREYMPVALIESGIFKFTQLLKWTHGEDAVKN